MQLHIKLVLGMGYEKPGFYVNICRRDAGFFSETGFFCLSSIGECDRAF
ncbi:hypothetical protein [Microcoleus sp.]